MTLDDKTISDVSMHEDAPGLAAEAHLANEEDHLTSKWKVIKNNPRVCAWCMYGVWLSLLVSYEGQAAGAVVGIPTFRRDFGSPFEGNYVLPAKWQSAFSGGPTAATVVGALVSGQINDMIGRKFSLTIALVISYVAITLEFVSTTNPVFFGGKFLNGFAVGILGGISATYVGETTPLALRGISTCIVALAYTIAPFIVALIQNSMGELETRWSYRAIFVSQYAVAGIATIFLPFMPESPWWLLSKGKDDKALKALKSLGYKPAEAERRLAVIRVTLDEVRQETEGATYAECFRRSNLRRTIISIAPLSIQALGGVVFIASFSTYYFQLAGYSTSASFKLNVVGQCLAIIGNIVSWELIDRVGRRPLILWGTTALTVLLIIVGGLATAGTPSAIKGAVALILLYNFLYNSTIGSSAYTILTETSTSRLRIKTISVGIAVQNLWYVLWTFTLPYLFNPDQADLGAKVSFIFGGLAVFCCVYLYFYQTETRNRSYEELDEMFMKKVPAKEFKTYVTTSELKGQEEVRRRTSATGLEQ